MDMGGGSMPLGPLSPAGVNFSDPDQAANFLLEILDDDMLKIWGNDYARYFWYGIAVLVGICAIWHWTTQLEMRARLKAAAQRKSYPAKPQTVLTKGFATVTAMVRETMYSQLTPLHPRWFKVPPVGTIVLVLAHFAFVLALEFTNNNVQGAQFWQARGVRAGWLAVAQVPLLILLVGKHNLITLFTGVSVGRLNVLHRWTSRITLFLAILHMGYQNYGWTQFGLRSLEWATDTCPPTGVAAFAILLWMNLSTLAPFRYWSYEIFVIQHIITFFGFIIAIMFHLPSTALWSRIYIYIPIALYLIDRIVRTAFFAWNNHRLSRATLTALDGGATKVRLTNTAIKRWRPGAYVLLSIARFGMIQAHPATVVSTPHSHNGDMVFMLKSHKGFTKRIMTSANSSRTALLQHTEKEAEEGQNASVASYYATINGPYGGLQQDFAAFDSVCLIAGSTGVTFMLALLQDLADRADVTGNPLPLRRVHFVWAVKDSNWASWATDEISSAYSKLQSAGIECVISLYVTCSEEYTELEGDHGKMKGCRCDKSVGPCCCVAVANSTMNKQTAMAEKRMGSESESDDGITKTQEGTAGMRLPVLPCASFYSGRPSVPHILSATLDGAQGESGVATCGPLGLNAMVRNTIVRLSDERAMNKGSGAQGCYLHVESFS